MCNCQVHSAGPISDLTRDLTKVVVKEESGYLIHDRECVEEQGLTPFMPGFGSRMVPNFRIVECRFCVDSTEQLPPWPEHVLLFAERIDTKRDPQRMDVDCKRVSVMSDAFDYVDEHIDGAYNVRVRFQN